MFSLDQIIVIGTQKMQKISNRITLSKQTVSELAALANALSNQPDNEEIKVCVLLKENFDDFAQRAIKACGLENESEDIKLAFIEGLKEGERQLTNDCFSIQ